MGYHFNKRNLVRPPMIKERHRRLHSTRLFYLFYLDHNIRDLHILARSVVGCDFEDDVCLMGGNGFLAYVLHELIHSIRKMSVHKTRGRGSSTHFKSSRSANLAGG